MNEFSDQVKQWIIQRKSTFVNGMKEGGKIPDEKIKQLLEQSVWAPNHGLTQPWKFRVFSEQGVVRFFNAQKEIYKAITPPEKFKELKYQKYDSKPAKVSHIIAISCQLNPESKFPDQEDLVATACVVQNIYLSLDSLGIGGYLSTGDLCYSEPMRKFLNLHKNEVLLGFFMLGLPDPTFHRPERKRISATEKTEWISQ